MLPSHRAPTRPGEILREEFLKPMGITQAQLASALRVSIQTVNLLINGKRSITADTAVGLAELLGTTPEFWMNLQNAVDLWAAVQRRSKAHIPHGKRAARTHARPVRAQQRAGHPAPRD